MTSLENQQNFISTFVSSLSTITIALMKFSDVNNEYHEVSTGNEIKQYMLPIIFIIANILAIVYIKKTRVFIKMHQERAKILRQRFAPDIQLIYDQVAKPNSGTDRFNRNRIFILLHILIVFVAFLLLTSNF
jgi:hypothetical protein